MRFLPLALFALVVACSPPTAAPASTDAVTADQGALDVAVSLGDAKQDTALDGDANTLGDGLADTDAGAPLADAPTEVAADPDIEITLDVSTDIATLPDGGDGDASADVGGETSDAAIDTAADASPTVCKDLRKMGDNKVPADGCWAPPMHYCSTPYLSYIAFVCKPDFSVCMFGQCRPCGWIGCPMLEPGEPWPAWASPLCPKNYKDWMPGYGGQFAPMAAPYYPDPKATFCWDNAPAEWSDDAHHLDDEKIPNK